MKPSKINSRYSFDLFAWGMALLSLTIGAALIFGVLHVANKAYHSLQLAKVERAMVERRLNDARNELNKLFSGPPVIRYLKSRPLPPQQQELVADLFEASSFVEGGDFSTAEETLREATEKAREQSSVPLRIIASLEQLGKDISSIATQKSSITSATQKREQLIKRRETALFQTGTLIRDTTSLFSLPTSLVPSNSAALQFYTTGILRGLPMIPGLPDGVSSLKELSDKVSSIGGSLRLGDDSVQSLVRARIASLQEGGLSIQGTLEAVDAELSKLPVSLDADLETVASELSEFSERLQEQLIEISSGSAQ